MLQNLFPYMFKFRYCFACDTIHLLKHNEILLKGNPLMAAIDDHIDPIEP
jgi:hypothetical protein